jgi:hypothetical protein
VFIQLKKEFVWLTQVFVLLTSRLVFIRFSGSYLGEDDIYYVRDRSGKPAARNERGLEASTIAIGKPDPFAKHWGHAQVFSQFYNYSNSNKKTSVDHFWKPIAQLAKYIINYGLWTDYYGLSL